MTPVDGSPNIVWGAEFLLPCESWSLHQHALLRGAPNDPAEGLAADGSLAGQVLTGLIVWGY